MGHMYFVRHGQTVWNVENKICGSTDIDLTEKGHEQAVETGKKILSENIKADIILYSPLMRAEKTAKHISEITGIPAKAESLFKEFLMPQMQAIKVAQNQNCLILQMDLVSSSYRTNIHEFIVTHFLLENLFEVCKVLLFFLKWLPISLGKKQLTL